MSKRVILFISFMLLSVVINITAVAGAVELKIQSNFDGADLVDTSMEPMFRVVNSGDEGVELSDVKFRYYYSLDSLAYDQLEQTFAVDYTAIGSENVTLDFVLMDETTATANYYIEIGFLSDAGILEPEDYVELSFRIWEPGWATYNKNNDFSFIDSGTEFVDNENIVAFVAGDLNWGNIPEKDDGPGIKPEPEEPLERGDIYQQRFLELWSDIHDPENGYFSAEGIPYHSVETLICEAPDYGHETTSEAFSYYMWLEAMYGKITGDWSQLELAWETTEKYMIPDLVHQPGLDEYDPSKPASYAPEWGTPEKYPAQIDTGVSVGIDPLHDELVETYGTTHMYGMHWQLDVDNWYGFGKGTEPTFINTFQRGEQESVWEAVPHPSVELFEYGGENGYLDLFVLDGDYKEQARYTNAPDADARAVQVMYWAEKWAEEQGEDLTPIIEKSVKMGDYLRYAMFDKYFKEIGVDDIKSTGTGYDSAHYLLSWYYAWGGGVSGYWSWKIGSSHSHFGYQNPMAAYVLSSAPEFEPPSPNGEEDWSISLQRQLEFYTWLQSAEGGIAGGATNSWKGRYEEYPEGTATFYGMAYDDHPVYHDPGSNEWFGFQAWSMQRIAELYLETGDNMARNLMDNWVDWVKSEVNLYDDGTFEIPATLEWSGQPETWVQGSTTWENPGLHVEVVNHGTDLGIAGSLANTLIHYAAATEEHDVFDQEAYQLAKELLDRMWVLYRDDMGIAAPEKRGDYERFFDEIYIPEDFSGTMPNGDVVESGVRFIDIRSNYLDDPGWETVVEAVEAGEDPEFTYHRFWAQVDIAVALGAMATYFPEEGEDLDLGDVNSDSLIDSLDYAILRRYTTGNYDDINFANSDMDQDGDITSLDVVRLRRELIS